MAFPTVSTIIDDFSDGDNVNINANWTEGFPVNSGTTWAVVSGVIAQTGAAQSVASAYWNAGTFGPDIDIFINLVNVPKDNGDRAGLVGSIWNIGSSTTDGYGVHIRKDNINVYHLRIQRIENDTTTDIGTSTLTDARAGDKMGIEIRWSGNRATIKVYEFVSAAWVEVHSFEDTTDPFTATAGAPGVNNGEVPTDVTDPQFDDLAGGTAVGAPAGFAHSQAVIIG
ncbi:hypothetical protein LCGC14_1552810 [marine sediment metagenome]|uniref:Uncharacterized protein n=1 Tax=marine sediment metagenome TaxID=412755 RepID=A0A0F9LQL8_9ZZZZ